MDKGNREGKKKYYQIQIILTLNLIALKFNVILPIHLHFFFTLNQMVSDGLTSAKLGLMLDHRMTSVKKGCIGQRWV